jgi:hypothetical protein
MVPVAKSFEFQVEELTTSGLVQPAPEEPPPASGGKPTRTGLVPATGVSYLAVCGDQSPQVLPEPPEADFEVVGRLEALRYQQGHHLAICADPELRINGRRAAPVAILKVGDQLRIGNQWLLHVSRFVRPHIGPPPSDYVDKECSSCRLPLTADTTIYICPNCGLPYHCEPPLPDDAAESTQREPLECARLISTCNHCPQPVVFGEHHEFVPSD